MSIAQRVLGEWAKTQNEARNIFRNNDVCNIPLTHHGENRIQHCRKYNLSNNCRLITVFDQDTQIFLFLGTHDECDKWLNKNRDRDFLTNTNTVITDDLAQKTLEHISNNTVKIVPEIMTKVTQLRDEINALKYEIDQWSTLLDYDHRTSLTTDNSALENDRMLFLQNDIPFFFERVDKIAENLKKNNTIIVQNEIDSAAFFMEVFFLKIRHIDKLKQLVSLTKH